MKEEGLGNSANKYGIICNFKKVRLIRRTPLYPISNLPLLLSPRCLQSLSYYARLL